MSKHAIIELTEGLLLRISAHGEASHVEAKAALNRVGARLLHDALEEYLGLKAMSAGRGHATMFVGEDLTEHQKPSRKSGVVRLDAPPGGVARLSPEDRRRGRSAR